MFRRVLGSRCELHPPAPNDQTMCMLWDFSFQISVSRFFVLFFYFFRIWTRSILVQKKQGFFKIPEFVQFGQELVQKKVWFKAHEMQQIVLKHT